MIRILALHPLALVTAALALGCDDPEDKRRALQDVAMGVLGRLTVEEQGRKPADAKPKNVE